QRSRPPAPRCPAPSPTPSAGGGSATWSPSAPWTPAGTAPPGRRPGCASSSGWWAGSASRARRSRRRVSAHSTVDTGGDGAAGPAAGLRELERLLAGLSDRAVLVLRSPFYMENL